MPTTTTMWRRRKGNHRNATEHTHNYTCARCDFVLTAAAAAADTALLCLCGTTHYTDVELHWMHEDDALSPFKEPSHYWFRIFFLVSFSCVSQIDIFRFTWPVLSCTSTLQPVQLHNWSVFLFLNLLFMIFFFSAPHRSECEHNMKGRLDPLRYVMLESSS